MAIHQLPSILIHETSHALAYKAAGGSGVNLSVPLPSCMEVESNNGRKRILTLGAFSGKEELSGSKKAFILIAPYAVKMLVVDRVIEAAYRKKRIPIDSFGDKYILTNLMLNLEVPLVNAIYRQTDLSEFSREIKIPRIIVAGAIQALYVWSYIRVMHARGEEKTWMFYFRTSF